MLVIPTFDDPRIGDLLRGGAIGVIPTDTTYCIVVSAAMRNSVQQVYALTGRTDAPGVLLSADSEDIAEYGFDEKILEAADNYWPAAIDVEFQTPEGLQFLDLGKGSLAIRVPGSDSLGDLLAQTGPLLAVEACPPGQPQATSFQMAERYFGEQVDFYVAGSDRSNVLPATLVKFNGRNVQILRQGGVTINPDGTIAGRSIAQGAGAAPTPGGAIAMAPAGNDSAVPVDIPMEGEMSLRPNTVITPTRPLATETSTPDATPPSSPQPAVQPPAVQPTEAPQPPSQNDAGAAPL